MSETVVVAQDFAHPLFVVSKAVATGASVSDVFKAVTFTRDFVQSYNGSVVIRTKSGLDFGSEKVLVPYQPLASFVGSCVKSQQIKIYYDEETKTLKLVAGRRKAQIKCVEASSIFISIPKDPIFRVGVVNLSKIFGFLSKVVSAHATSTDEMGVSFVRAKGGIGLCATDRISLCRVIARHRMKGGDEAEFNDHIQRKRLVVPVEAAGVVSRLDFSSAVVEFFSDKIVFRRGSTVVACGLLTAMTPLDYASVIKATAARDYVPLPGTLLNSLDSARAFADDRRENSPESNKAVELSKTSMTVADGRITLQTDAKYGAFVDRSVSTEHTDIEVSINSNRLSLAASYRDAGSLRFSVNEKSIAFTNADKSYLFLSALDG